MRVCVCELASNTVFAYVVYFKGQYKFSKTIY